MILAATLFLMISLPSLASGLVEAMRSFLEQPHLIRVEGEDARHLLFAMVGDIGMLLAFPVVLFLAAAVAPGLLQTGFLASAESLKPKFEKISPLSGLKRRSEERRVGKEGVSTCRYRRTPNHEKKKKPQ